MPRATFFAILEGQTELANRLEAQMVKELQRSLLAHAVQRIASHSEASVIQ